MRQESQKRRKIQYMKGERRGVVIFWVDGQCTALKASRRVLVVAHRLLPDIRLIFRQLVLVPCAMPGLGDCGTRSKSRGISDALFGCELLGKVSYPYPFI